MYYKTRQRLMLLIFVLVLVGTCYWTYKNNTFINGHITEKLLLYRDEYEDFERIDEKYVLAKEVEDIIREDSIIIPEKLDYIDGGIYGMLDTFEEPYTRYLNKSETKLINDGYSGLEMDLGIDIYERDKKLLIKNIDKSSDIYNEPINRNDEIVMINGEKLAREPIVQYTKSLLNRDKTPEFLIKTYKNDGSIEFIDIKTDRNRKKIRDLEYHLIDNIGYIDIRYFTNKTVEKYIEAFNELEELGAEKLIVDFRDLEDGLAGTQFFSRITIEQVAGKLLGDSQVSLITDEKMTGKLYGVGEKTDLPYIILINENTEAIGEQIVGAVKSNNLAVEILGEKTSGKGTLDKYQWIQNGGTLIFPKYEVKGPSGEKIRKVGIEPSIKIELEATKGIGYDYLETDNQLKEAIRILKEGES